VLAFTEAIAGDALDHVPPEVVLLRDVVLPLHTVAEPLIALTTGSGSTVNGVVM
jgi:hypothetical protein